MKSHQNPHRPNQQHSKLEQQIQQIKTLYQEKQSIMKHENSRPQMMKVFRMRNGSAGVIQVRPKNSIANQLAKFRSQWESLRTDPDRSHLDDGSVLSVSRSHIRPKTLTPKTTSSGRVQTEQQLSHVSKKILPNKKGSEGNETVNEKEHKRDELMDDQIAIQSPYCFVIDFSFLDDVHVEDERLRKTLTENFWMQPQSEMEQFVDDNGDYLLHQFGQCACGKCTCGSCACQYRHTRNSYHPMSTTYNSSFVASRTTLNQIDSMNLTHHENLFPQEHQRQLEPEHPTNHRTAYKNSPLQPKFIRKYQKLTHNPFLSASMNQHQYKNWHNYDPNWIFHRPSHDSVVRILNLQGFILSNCIVHLTQQECSSSQKSIITVHPITIYCSKTILCLSPDLKTSNYQNDFRSFKIKDVPNTYLPFRYKTETEVYKPTETYQGQFRASNSVWYRAPMNTKERVIQLPWKNKLIAQLRLLHSTKNN